MRIPHFSMRRLHNSLRSCLAQRVRIKWKISYATVVWKILHIISTYFVSRQYVLKNGETYDIIVEFTNINERKFILCTQGVWYYRNTINFHE